VFKNSPIGLYIRAVKAAFDWLKEKLGPFWQWIKDKWKAFTDLIEGVIRWLKENKSRIIEFIKAPFIAAFNAIARAWNATVGGISFTFPDWLRYVSPLGALLAGKSFTIPSAPVIDTSGNSGPSPAEARKSNDAGPGRASVVNNNYYVTGAIDPRGTASTIARVQDQRQRQVGRVRTAVVL
jgi:hypothetical protein